MECASFDNYIKTVFHPLPFKLGQRYYVAMNEGAEFYICMWKLLKGGDSRKGSTVHIYPSLMGFK